MCYGYNNLQSVIIICRYDFRVSNKFIYQSKPRLQVTKTRDSIMKFQCKNFRPKPGDREIVLRTNATENVWIWKEVTGACRRDHIGYMDALGLPFSCYYLLVLLLCGSQCRQDTLSRGRLHVHQMVLHSLLLLKTNLHGSWHAYPLEQ
jgi:hypothetical protein